MDLLTLTNRAELFFLNQEGGLWKEIDAARLVPVRMNSKCTWLPSPSSGANWGSNLQRRYAGVPRTFQLDKMLVEWKQETPWLAEAPAHALQQAILDPDRAYTNFSEKRVKFPKFHKKGVRDSFRESDRRASNWSKQQPHAVAKDCLGTLPQQP